MLELRLPDRKNAPKGKYTLGCQEDLLPTSAAIDVEAILRLLEGRWKLVILFHLFGGKVQRFSDLEKLVTGISQKMLAQQLRQLEDDGIVTANRSSPGAAQGRLPADRMGANALSGARRAAPLG